MTGPFSVRVSQIQACRVDIVIVLISEKKMLISKVPRWMKSRFFLMEFSSSTWIELNLVWSLSISLSSSLSLFLVPYLFGVWILGSGVGFLYSAGEIWVALVDLTALSKRDSPPGEGGFVKENVYIGESSRVRAHFVVI